MALTKLQKLSAQAIVQIFETGSVQGDYGAVTVLPGDTGHLTYGKAQTTLGSGNLYFLIRDYCNAPQAEFARKLRPFLPRLEQKDARLDNHRTLKQILRSAGDDAVMRRVQDEFFDRVYWAPTLESAEYIGATSALGLATIYDSRIHGSWHGVRDQVIAQHGSLSSLGENAWMKKYVDYRRHWLATHSNPALHPTVYRMDELRSLMNAGKWSLALPLTVKGCEISETSLGAPQSPAPRLHRSPRTFLFSCSSRPRMFAISSSTSDFCCGFEKYVTSSFERTRLARNQCGRSSGDGRRE